MPPLEKTTCRLLSQDQHLSGPRSDLVRQAIEKDLKDFKQRLAAERDSMQTFVDAQSVEERLGFL